jgi:DNA topoisomerase II
MWVYDSEKESMVFRDVKIVPGLYKIFDEILVNAADNKIRDPNMDTIRVTVDRENGLISIMNNGRGIPIEIHEKEKIYIPELIFGHLLTSSNYDDNEKKVVGGRNGYGAKLCNIFSTEFTVETADKQAQQKYVQTWTQNMSKVGKAKITSNKGGKEYTTITFKPDLRRFGMETLDADFEAVVKRRVYDLAGCVRGVKVELNGERIKIKNFKQYVEMYVSSNAKKDERPGLEGLNLEAAAIDATPKIIHQVVSDRWEVAFTVSDGQFNQVSFVNSIATTKGGTHVEHVCQQIIAKLVEEVKKKNKAAAVKPHQIKQHLWLFVNCLIENPAFDSQTKENMTLRPSSFGSKCNLSDDFIRKGTFCSDLSYDSLEVWCCGQCSQFCQI